VANSACASSISRLRSDLAIGAPEAVAEEYVTHQELLQRGVILIEDLPNLAANPGPRTFVVCARMRLAIAMAHPPECWRWKA
jgi:kynurenine formamidase